jgi:hypothetical protein
MKKKVFFVVTLGIALALGMVLTGCEEPCTCSVTHDPRVGVTIGTTCGKSSCSAHRAMTNNTAAVPCDC